jgi:hypothetical protein
MDILENILPRGFVISPKALNPEGEYFPHLILLVGILPRDILLGGFFLWRDFWLEGILQPSHILILPFKIREIIVNLEKK